MKRFLNKVIYILPILLGVYMISLAILYIYQKKLIFRPQKLTAGYAFKFDHPFQEFDIPLNDSTKLNAVMLKADTPHGLVIYFHGNKGNITRYAPYTSVFLSHHYNVLMMDYPGYGKSSGPDAEEDFYEDARLMYELARNYFSADSIIIYGKSLGTAMAAQLASRHPCKAVILECPFYSMDALARHYLGIFPIQQFLVYHFPVNQFLAKVVEPVIIFHGKKDGVIPYKQSERLQAILKQDDRFISIPAGGHNDLYAQPLYQQVMDSLLSH